MGELYDRELVAINLQVSMGYQSVNHILFSSNHGIHCCNLSIYCKVVRYSLYVDLTVNRGYTLTPYNVGPPKVIVGL